MSVVWTIVILGLLIFVHEWGHFLMARLCRVAVKTFSLGFGPKLIGKNGVRLNMSFLPFL